MRLVLILYGGIRAAVILDFSLMEIKAVVNIVIISNLHFLEREVHVE